MNILQDIKTAVKLTGEIRRAREAGADAVKIQPVYTLPMLKIGYWGFTVETCIIYDREMEKAVIDVFKTFPEPVQHSLTFSPKNPGDWVDRARFWQQELKPVLHPKMYHAVMILFINWYAHCLRVRKKASV